MKEKFRNFVKVVGLPRLIIGSLFIIVLIAASAYKLDMAALFTNILRRYGMWGILVLAMVPGIQCGIGPNFGISLGIVCGLLGALLSIEFGFTGFMAFIFAVIFAGVIASLVGAAYGWFLNKVKGSEMTVSTYIGFASIAVMNIFWASAPFQNGEIKWPIGGTGVRTTVSLQSSFKGVLDTFMEFKIGAITVPTGLILFFFLMCAVIWVFLNSKTGKAMRAAGANPVFARASGINVDRMRILGTAISTALAGIGIVAYASAYGFLQMYNAPMQMGFQCVAAVFIGGASTSDAKISHVIIGTLLFHGLLVVGLPVASKILAGTDLSDIMRMIIQNGIIIYAITKSTGGSVRAE